MLYVCSVFIVRLSTFGISTLDTQHSPHFPLLHCLTVTFSHSLTLSQSFLNIQQTLAHSCRQSRSMHYDASRADSATNPTYGPCETPYDLGAASTSGNGGGRMEVYANEVR